VSDFFVSGCGARQLVGIKVGGPIPMLLGWILTGWPGFAGNAAKCSVGSKGDSCGGGDFCMFGFAGSAARCSVGSEGGSAVAAIPVCSDLLAAGEVPVGSKGDSCGGEGSRSPDSMVVRLTEEWPDSDPK